LLVSLSCTARAAEMPETRSSTIGDVASLLEGQFTTAPAPIDSAAAPQARILTILAKRVQVPSLGHDVVYSELHENSADGPLLRQSLFALKMDDAKNQIVMTVYEAGNAQELKGAYADSTPLAKLNAANLKQTPGSCEIVWHKTEGGYDGDADPQSCKDATPDSKTLISVSKTGMTELIDASQPQAIFRRVR
jgi:hypothetical protein